MKKREITATSLRSGLQFEQDFFGIHSGVLHHLELPIVTDLHSNTLNVYCHTAFQMDTYGFNPENPNTELAQKLFRGIQDSLIAKDKRRLRMYCLLGTAADRLGVDCFIRLRGTNRKVFIDLTTNLQKKDTRNILMLYPWHLKSAIGMRNFVQRLIDILHPRH